MLKSNHIFKELPDQEDQETMKARDAQNAAL